MKKYVVHCVGDDDSFTTLCAPEFGRSRWDDDNGESHMVVPASRVVNSSTMEEFKNGRTFVSEKNKNLSMRFCQDCVNHPDLELKLLAEA